MLLHPTIEKLRELKLNGMARALEEQLEMSDVETLSFEERFGLLVDREESEQSNRRTARRLRAAKLKEDATIEDIDFRQPRGMDKRQILFLGGCGWIPKHENCLITGPTGSGKTYVACSLANKACREGYKSLYLRMPRVFNEITIAKCDGRYEKLMTRWSRTHVLILDDWGIAPLTDENRRDLLEILDDRYGRCSTIVTSQLPVKAWHEYLGDPTLADSILDRLIHNAHRVNLRTKKSIREARSTLKKK